MEHKYITVKKESETSVSDGQIINKTHDQDSCVTDTARPESSEINQYWLLKWTPKSISTSKLNM